MPGRRLTVLIIPEEGGGTYEYKIPRLWLWLGLAGAAGLLLLLVWGLKAMITADQLAARVERLQRDKQILVHDVERIDQLETMLRQLETSNRRLRSITAEAVGLETGEADGGGRRAQEKFIPIEDRLRFGTLRSVPTLAPAAVASWRRFGDGVLLKAPEGSLVVASATGRVEDIVFDRDSGFRVRVDHRNGVQSRYGGLGALTVQLGDYVQKGQPLGLTGMPRDGSTPGLRFTILEAGKPRSHGYEDLWL